MLSASILTWMRCTHDTLVGRYHQECAVYLGTQKVAGPSYSDIDETACFLIVVVAKNGVNILLASGARMVYQYYLY